ncbi:MAG: hypothetical protein A2Z71_03605 [Chloroflexi bacterium RBG_13_50_21]|nr:MAG: hypothetical protein A2Z71_03605 [Chloroflexi bacterium RBG_13_50_21]
MDNPKPNLKESEFEPQPEPQLEPQPAPQLEPSTESQPTTEPEFYARVKEWSKRAFERLKLIFQDAKDNYQDSPRFQKVAYQRKFLPAFWTVACIFSLVINIILIAVLISFGRNFFQLKALISNGLVTEASNSLVMMDKAHIVTTVPVETTVQLQDSLPVVFDLPINQDTQLSLVQDVRITGAYIYLNNTAVLTDLTLPAKTPILANLDLTIPVSTSVPVDITVPVSMQVPVDIAVDQTDMHQSIVGLQGAIEPYKILMGSAFNSPKDFSMCNHWWSGWMCSIFFGKQ